jgi:hypothetical protein
MVGAVRGFPPLPPIPCRRLPFGILPFSCALGCPIGRGPQSHPVVASVRSGAGRSRILWSRVAMVGAARGFPSLPAPKGDAALFAMAVALVPVPQCFYGLDLLPYLWQFSSCETMRFYSP